MSIISKIAYIGTLFTGLVSLSVIAETYTYDAQSRLRVVEQGDAITAYTYDDAGNRKTTVTSAEPPNNEPVCSDKSIYMGNVPTFAGPVNIILQESNFVTLCADSDNDSLSVTAPSVPHSFTVASGQTVNINYTVSDGKGGDDSGTVTYSRP